MFITSLKQPLKFQRQAIVRGAHSTFSMYLEIHMFASIFRMQFGCIDYPSLHWLTVLLIHQAL